LIFASAAFYRLPWPTCNFRKVTVPGRLRKVVEGRGAEGARLRKVARHEFQVWAPVFARSFDAASGRGKGRKGEPRRHRVTETAMMDDGQQPGKRKVCIRYAGGPPLGVLDPYRRPKPHFTE
jgi:hypothetical protein